MPLPLDRIPVYRYRLFQITREIDNVGTPTPPLRFPELLPTDIVGGGQQADGNDAVRLEHITYARYQR